LPLLFAVRFLIYGSNVAWVIWEDSKREQTSFKINISDCVRSLRPILWNEYFYMITPRLKVQAVYDLDYNVEAISHSEFGNQKELRCTDGDRVFSFSNEEAVMFRLFFNGFQLEETDIIRNGTVTNRCFTPRVNLCSVADSLYACNKFVRDSASRIIARS